MKHHKPGYSILTLLLLMVLTALIPSCKNLEDTKKLVAIGDLGLQVLVAKQVINPEDADLARQTGQILITPTPPSAPPSGK